MLSTTEQIAFVLLVLVCGGLAFQGFQRIYLIVSQGEPSYRTDNFPSRLIKALIEVGLQKPLFKSRPIVSLFHSFIFFGFSFYLLVNINDLLEAISRAGQQSEAQILWRWDLIFFLICSVFLF